MGLTRSSVFPSRYVGKDDVQTPVRTIVTDVRMETVKTDHGDEEKPVMLFGDGIKPMIVNSTNWDTLEAAYGLDTDQWTGKPVELYVDPGVTYGGRRVGGVRVRVPPSKVAPTGNGAVPFDTILAEAAAVGMSRADMVAALKAKDLNAYNSVRDAATARAIIAERSAPEEAFEEPFAGSNIDPNGGEGSIPF